MSQLLRPPSRSSTGGKPRRTALAGGVSILVHGVTFLALWSSASGELMATTTAGESGAPPMAVFVISAADLGLQPRPQPRARGLAPLVADNSDAPPVFLPEPERGAPLVNLMRRLQAAEPRPWARPADTPRRTGESREEAAASEAAGGPTAAAPGSTGAFRGRLEPCWRNVAARAQVPVTLEIAVDRTGSVSTPPKVIRAGGATLDERRLRSEALAVAAVAGCLPRGDLSFSGQVFRLNFAPER